MIFNLYAKCDLIEKIHSRVSRVMKKIIVTGGAGFIGSHLVERLVKEGHQVIVLDNFSTGQSRNLSHLTSAQNLSIQKLDVSNFDDILPHFKNIEWVFHLAALADIVPSIEKPLDYYRSNVTGTFSVLEASRLSGIERFVYAASSSCYGIPDVYPTSESALIRPQYPYALTKYLGEEAVMHWNQVYKLPGLSLRLFNVYGPRARTSGTYGAVFGIFLAQKLAKKPFTIVGDGKQTRDFTYVTDVVDAMLKAAQSNLSGEIFNVGSGGSYSVNHLVELLGGEATYIPKRPGEPDRTFADIKKIKKYLLWNPKVNFEQGVQMMLQHIEDWRSAPVWNEKSIAEATKTWFTYLARPSKEMAISQKAGR